MKFKIYISIFDEISQEHEKQYKLFYSLIFSIYLNVYLNNYGLKILYKLNYTCSTRIICNTMKIKKNQWVININDLKTF